MFDNRKNIYGSNINTGHAEGETHNQEGEVLAPQPTRAARSRRIQETGDHALETAHLQINNTYLRNSYIFTIKYSLLH